MLYVCILDIMLMFSFILTQLRLVKLLMHEKEYKQSHHALNKLVIISVFCNT